MDQGPIVLFDGVCNLCNSSVNFILDRDRGKKIKFASLQSGAAAKLLAPFRFPGDDLSTIVLLLDGKLHTRSGAVLRISRFLGFPWSLGISLLVIPRFLRDFAYGVVARNRYRWFGKREQCRLPEPGIRDRFLE